MAKADDFYQKVIEKNTFYYFNQDFEERYGAEQIGSLRGLLYNLFLQSNLTAPYRRAMLTNYCSSITACAQSWH